LQLELLLVRSGQGNLADAMLHRMQAHAAIAPPINQKTWTEVALPIAQGMVAHAQGHWSAAVADLGTALPNMQAIGGSHAQRDVFVQVYLDALMRSGETTLARHLIEKRMGRQKISALQRQWNAITSVSA
jgi:hypothetical protein